MDRRRVYPLSSEEIINPQLLGAPGLKAALGLTVEEFGATVGRSPRSAARWLAEEHAEPASGPVARSLRRLAHLEFLLIDVIGRDRGAEWLRRPNPGFRGEAPLDLMTSGRMEEVIAVLETLADGAPG